MAMRTLQCLAVLFTAMALVPTGAHFFELFNKMALSRSDYFVVQGIYRGWALFGIALFGALALNFALAIAQRHQKWPCRLASTGFLSVAATLAIFFTWTYPANQVTANWTVAPENWEALRMQWEYAHAVNAGLTLLALAAVTISVVIFREETGTIRLGNSAS